MPAPFIRDYYTAPDGHQYLFTAEIEDEGGGSYRLRSVTASSKAADKTFRLADITYDAHPSQRDTAGRSQICMAIDAAIKGGY